MINHYSVLNAIKTLLDADATLRTLLKRKEDSKVFIGEMPPAHGYPMLQVVLMTDNHIDTWHDLSELVIFVNVHTLNPEIGGSDVDSSAAIIARCHALIDDQSLTVSGGRVYTMYIEGRNPAVHDPSNRNYSIEGLRCRMFAA